MALSEEQRYYLKLKALYYYYENGYTQTEISKMLNISRVTLGRLMDEEKKEGMVKIEIVDIRGSMETLQLEEQIRNHFDLLDVKLVDSSNLISNAEINQRIAAAASEYFEQIIKSNLKIGITWGRTLNMMVEHLRTNKSVNGLEILTLLGGTSQSPSFQPNILAQRLIEKYNGQIRIITAPFICQSDELCAAMKNDPAISSVLEASKSVDITLVGIGEEPVKDSESLSDYPFDKATINELVSAGAVGDICGNFFDIEGVLCDTSIKNRIVSINPHDLINHKKVIGIGGGPGKIRSILGALNGHYLQVLISDTETAKAMLSFL